MCSAHCAHNLLGLSARLNEASICWRVYPRNRFYLGLQSNVNRIIIGSHTNWPVGPSEARPGPGHRLQSGRQPLPWSAAPPSLWPPASLPPLWPGSMWPSLARRQVSLAFTIALHCIALQCIVQLIILLWRVYPTILP